MDFNKYIKENFTKKHNYNRLFFFCIACVIVLVPSIIMHWYVTHTTNAGFVYPTSNAIIHLNITTNDGIAFSNWSGSTAFIFIVQTLMALILLAFIFNAKSRLLIFGLSCIFLGALFNIFDRAIPTAFAVAVDSYAAGDKIPFIVVDYLQFGGFLSWFGAIFNFPDMFIVTGTIFTAITFTVLYFKSNKEEEKE